MCKVIVYKCGTQQNMYILATKHKHMRKKLHTENAQKKMLIKRQLQRDQKNILYLLLATVYWYILGNYNAVCNSECAKVQNLKETKKYKLL